MRTWCKETVSRYARDSKKKFFDTFQGFFSEMENFLPHRFDATLNVGRIFYRSNEISWMQIVALLASLRESFLLMGYRFCFHRFDFSFWGYIWFLLSHSNATPWDLSKYSLKKRNENSSTWVIFNSFPLIKRAFSSWVDWTRLNDLK